MRAGLPREAILRRARDFEAVYRSGERVSARPLRVRALPRREPGGSQSRLGLSVGRKLGNAVARNSWKRAIREAFRLHRHELPGPYDVVVSVEWGSSEADVSQVERAFLAIVAGLRRDHNP